MSSYKLITYHILCIYFIYVSLEHFSRYFYLWYLTNENFENFQIYFLIILILVNTWSLLFQKGTQVGIFNFFHFWFFVAFNSRDMTMLWVLNLYSRSSPTKLWKQIFYLRSKKKFWHSKLARKELFS